MRTWLFTCTTYGTWLPGDARGSVTSVRERRVGETDSKARQEHDRYGTPFEESIPGLQLASAATLKGPPVLLTKEQAILLLEQFHDTASYRDASLLAVAIMTNHFHLIASSSSDRAPGKLLGDFKAYGTRRLNEAFGRPRSETWWTAQGSKRLLPNSRAIASAIHYVLHRQPSPLVTWSPEAQVS